MKIKHSLPILEIGETFARPTASLVVRGFFRSEFSRMPSLRGNKRSTGPLLSFGAKIDSLDRFSVPRFRPAGAFWDRQGGARVHRLRRPTAGP